MKMRLLGYSGWITKTITEKDMIPQVMEEERQESDVQPADAVTIRMDEEIELGPLVLGKDKTTAWSVVAPTKRGFSNSAFAVVGELFAPNVKALGTSLTNSIGFVCAFLSVQLFYAIRSAFGVHFGIWSFALINALAVVFTAMFVPNTSGLSLLEIQELLSRPWFNNKCKVAPIEKFTKKDEC